MKEKKIRTFAKISKQGDYLMAYIPKKMQGYFKKGEHILISKVIDVPISIISKISKHGSYLCVYIPKGFHKKFKEKELIIISKLIYCAE